MSDVVGVVVDEAGVVAVGGGVAGPVAGGCETTGGRAARWTMGRVDTPS